MISSILLVVVVVSLLITIHEFGHLIVAKLARIPVEAFSIGFGPVLLKKKWGGTEYRLSLVPLGGYIKMTGEDDDTKGGFNQKPFGIKAAVIAAGPVSNLVLGFVLLSVMFSIFGTRYISPVADPAPGSPAGEVFKPGDLLLAVNGDTIPSYDHFERALETNAGKELTVTLLRNGRRLDIAYTVPTDTWYTEERIRPVVGRVKPDSPADSLGLEPGDRIVGFAGDSIATWQQLTEAIGSRPGERSSVTWLRNDSIRTDSVTPTAGTDEETGEPEGQLGVWVQMPPRDLEPLLSPVVGRVRGGGPASQIGMQSGDTITGVAGIEVSRWDEVLETVGRRPGETVSVTWKHLGEMRSDSVTLASEVDQLSGERVGQLGIWVRLAHRDIPVHLALWEGMKRTGYVVVQTFAIVYKVITRQISAKAIGGPVFVAKVAYEGASWGAEYFIALWALLSINLFVVNMLPIPVLDGGRILLFVIESVRRRRLTEKEISVAMNIGWAIVGLIFVVVLFNDIVRLIRN